jgi:solute carrier family 25 carnitine/acylcarnitine transporter 20/29
MTSYTQLIRDLYSENGIRSLYKGFWGTFWRDVPIFGAFFFIYEYLSRSLIRSDDSEARKHAKLILISGLAGICNWVPTYPADLVKSII